MRPIRMSLAQINPIVGDIQGNTKLIAQWSMQAADAGADIVAFPELTITGYPPEDLLLRRSFVQDNLSALNTLASEISGIAAVVGFVDAQDDLYNAAAVISDGSVQAVYHKHLLPNYGVFDEERYFEAGRGILLVRIGGVLAGVTVCEDIWEPRGPHADCVAAGATIIININASPYQMGKAVERETMLARRATDHRVALAYVNTVGGQDELVFDGASCAFSPNGRLLARAGSFREELLTVEFDADAVFDERLRDPRVRHGRTMTDEPTTLLELETQNRERIPVEHRIAPLLDVEEEVYEALVLGTRDYCLKNGFETAVIGLSGGIDSSLTLCIAVDALGPEQILGVSMPSEFTSSDSVEDAQAGATRLGVRTSTIPITQIFGLVLSSLAQVFEGRAWGLAEENLQARIRGMALMAISNKTGRIVLTTGNKSEMATGYATLYGDMAGGFAVLKDVPKTLVYKLALWRNRARGDAIPQRIITKVPTAELRRGQRDSDSLPPYEVLDPILQAYIENDDSVEDIVARGADPEVVEKVAALVEGSEYKRRQAPPGVKITRRAFGKDRRLPITNRYR